VHYVDQQDESSYGHYKNKNRGEYEEIDDVDRLMIRKVKPHEVNYGAKPAQMQDFSVTENYFHKDQNILSPRLQARSQTIDAWGSPTKQSRFKLSQFTSEKKMRKETAPRNNLSYAQAHVVQPYLQYFQSLIDFATFRRNCFENAYTLVASEELTVNCLATKEGNAKVNL